MAELTQQTSAADRIFGMEAGSNSGESELVRGSAGVSPLCPHCGSNKLWRDGLRYSLFGDRIQRWLCRNCWFRFSDSDDVQRALTAFKRVERVDTKAVKGRGDKALECQICVKETKNLAAEQKAMEVPRRSDIDTKGKIVEHAFWMQKEGYAEATITRRIRLLKTLANKGANLLDPESLKETIAKQQKWSNKTKEIAVETYACFLKMQGKTWNPPRYKACRKLPFIPTENELNSLIAGCNRRTSVFLQLLKETGMRCGEAFMLNWTDFNFENKSVSITPEKGSEPRQLKTSTQLIAMLNSLPKEETGPFNYSNRHFARTFREQRSRIACKLKNDRIRRITFHTLRHWKATMEYAKTKDILHVMRILGHKNIQNTLLYTQLISFENDDFHSATAKTVQEIQKLVEAGFEYVCESDEVKIFRKRK